MQCFCHRPPLTLSTNVSDVSVPWDCSYEHLLWVRQLYNGQKTEIPNDCPRGSTYSPQRTCKLALKELGSSPDSAMNLVTLGKNPYLGNFNFILVKSYRHLPQRFVMSISYNVFSQRFYQINKTQV